MLRNPEQTKKAVIGWIQKYFEQYAPGASAVIGISGGKDSSVAAALCVEALGKERVIGVMMPDGMQSDIADSRTLVSYLEIPHMEINIQKIKGAYEDVLRSVPLITEICGQPPLSKQAQINLPPRIRMSVLYVVAQTLTGGGLVVNTCNRSEDYVGYSTKYGDAAGDFSPLAGFTVREVLQLGEVLSIPEHLLEKEPSDGLSGMPDEEKLGFTYEILDNYIETGICEDSETKRKIDLFHKNNLHKLQPIPFYHKSDSE